MRFTILAFALALSLGAAAQPAKVTVLDDDEIARAIVSAASRDDIAANDPRVASARSWLAKAAKVYGEDEKAVAAHCERTARWLSDLARKPATAFEMLEALALLAKPGASMHDDMRRYVEARRAAPTGSHAAALKQLGL